jgi:hypothetical protein
MKKRKTTRSPADGRAKQTEGNGQKTKPRTPRKTGGHPTPARRGAAKAGKKKNAAKSTRGR